MPRKEELEKENKGLKQSCQNWFEHCRENKQSELNAAGTTIASLSRGIDFNR